MIFLIFHQMYQTKPIKITTNNFLASLYQFLSMGVYISGLHSLRKRKKKTHFTSFMNFNHFGEPQLLHTVTPNIQMFLISIFHIFIPSIPFLTFFLFLIFFFFWAISCLLIITDLEIIFVTLEVYHIINWSTKIKMAMSS